MKSILFFIGINLLIGYYSVEKKTFDIKAQAVTEKRTEMNGIYYQYEIKNAGNTIIKADSYKVFLKVDGKTVSFDKSTSQLKPGETITYSSAKTFYQDHGEELDYALEIKMKDRNPENNILRGKSTF